HVKIRNFLIFFSRNCLCCHSKFSTSISEIYSAIMCLKLDKSPSPDGLPANFYRHFWVYLREFIFQQGFITLIPKPGRDNKVLDNYHLITLLNCISLYYWHTTTQID
uniref:Reverse transcriptase domain-containing protein n=1 Tax=Poecilia reticulata TaxID=8081 RepID=A0A3P9QCB9_POERE